jgi:hypothetical protein
VTMCGGSLARAVACPHQGQLRGDRGRQRVRRCRCGLPPGPGGRGRRDSRTRPTLRARKFPSTRARAERPDALATGRGYDVRPLNDVVVQAAGYGGGSLIYANVQMRPPADVFDDGWPRGYSRAALDPYYDLVAHMLDARPVEPDPSTDELPTKTRLMEEAAARLGRRVQFFHPSLRPVPGHCGPSNAAIHPFVRRAHGRYRRT